MQNISILMRSQNLGPQLETELREVTRGVRMLDYDESGALFAFPAAGGGVYLPELVTCKERYVTFWLEAMMDHSYPIRLQVYKKDDPDAAPSVGIMFGTMPRVRALICLDLNWLDAHILFPGHTAGQLKVVCFGGRVERSQIDRIILMSSPSHHEVNVRISDITLTDERPASFPLPDIKLIDELGQYKLKDWPQKVRGAADLKGRLTAALEGLPDTYGPGDWTRYGGWKHKKLAEGSGYFSKIKEGGRWWLVDPDGHAFFSMGPDCIVARADCRVDGLEKFLDWLPARDDPVYGAMYEDNNRYSSGREVRDRGTLFSFEQANLYRAFGDGWYDKWKALISRQLKQNGMNTLGNWSDEQIKGVLDIPYVTMLPRFPTTGQLIFRDFPDVFSDEYEANAKTCAQYLDAKKGDPYMIGYFLRNEPGWAFVNNLVIADEVLYNPAKTACKERLVAYLREKYGSPDKLSAAWGRKFASFDDLNAPINKASSLSDAANEDMRAFSRKMLEAYVSIPSRMCREVAPNHMNLGMRWAWISDKDIVTGWENFDVFSINCYSVDPTAAIENVASLGVDLPVVIGEFHFGALDAGLTSTGLEGVLNQRERGVAYRYYCERVAAHRNGVGCHWFQCYDQFELGRFDGENYNIGLFDICSQPSEDIMVSIRACSDNVYAVAAGEKPPTDQKPKMIPMVAF